jgi:hypothetical protein
MKFKTKIFLPLNRLSAVEFIRHVTVEKKTDWRINLPLQECVNRIKLYNLKSVKTTERTKTLHTIQKICK